jgi:hypothetical protein
MNPTASVSSPTPIPDAIRFLATMLDNETGTDTLGEVNRMLGITPPSPESKPDQSGDTTQMPQPVEAGWRDRCEVKQIATGWVVRFVGAYDLHPDGDWSEEPPASANPAGTRWMTAKFPSEFSARAALSKAPQPPDIKPDQSGDINKMVHPKAAPAPVVQPKPSEAAKRAAEAIGKDLGLDTPANRLARIIDREFQPAPKPTPSPEPEKTSESRTGEDIVKRMRERHDFGMDRIWGEAADTIERLTRERDELKLDNDRKARAISDLRGH